MAVTVAPGWVDVKQTLAQARQRAFVNAVFTTQADCTLSEQGPMELAVNAVASPQTRHPLTSRADVVAPASLADLVELARSRATDDRHRLLLGVAALCDAANPREETAPVLADIFMILTRQAERDIRRTLAEGLATAEWAPCVLINMLALDEIEIARPIIANSKLLGEQQLLRILVEATIEHHIAVARRPGLSGAVADAIIERGEPATMTALASNRSAEISEDGLRRLVEQSRRVAALRAPLTRHPRLNDELAAELYKWVGQALRQAICERFKVDGASMSRAVDQAVALATPSAEADRSVVTGREEMERRLVAKLQAAGQLRAGFLIRAIREKRLSLFEHGLAALSGFSVVQVHSAVTRASWDALFLACSTVGIDRAVFPAILAEIRTLTSGLPGDGPCADWSAVSLSPAASAREFRALIGETTV